MRNPVRLVRPSRPSPTQMALTTVAKAAKSAKDAVPGVSRGRAAGVAGIAAVTGIAVSQRDRLRNLLGHDEQRANLPTSSSPSVTSPVTASDAAKAP
jgi:hypothetical protein